MASADEEIQGDGNLDNLPGPTAATSAMGGAEAVVVMPRALVAFTAGAANWR